LKKDPVPLSLLVDDSCPAIHVYRNTWVDVHKKPPVAGDGREMARDIPNAFLDRFCDVVLNHGIAGKLSIVPCPGGLGDIVSGLAGHGMAEVAEWLQTAKSRLSPAFDFSPEGLTHTFAVDLDTGRLLAEDENAWSAHQDRKALRRYLTRQLALLKAAGVDASGVTSPWVFGKQVEDEYRAAIMDSQYEVWGRTLSWYFLDITDDSSARPVLIGGEDGRKLVSIPANMDDVLWATIWDFGKPDRGIVEGLADRFLTRDGRGGRIREILDGGGWPALVTHWQCLFSNGHETGLSVLDEVGKRVTRALGSEAEWTSCMRVAGKAWTQAGDGAVSEAR